MDRMGSTGVLSTPVCSQLDDHDVDQMHNKDFEPYLPWIDKHTQIRLLKITDALSTPVSAELVIVNVSDLPAMEYVALSYYWGEARTINDIHYILVNRRPFFVRTNLWKFFEASKSFNIQRPIYIDAICLNQLDFGERQEQVKLMSEIYRHAKQTLVWLGSAQREHDLNLAMLQYQLAECTSGEPWNTEAIVGLSYLCSRTYWRRLWVVQELLLSKSVVLHCGSYSFPWASIISLAALPLPKQFFSSPENTEWWHAWKLPRPVDYNQQVAQEESIHDGWRPALRLIHYREQWLLRNMECDSGLGTPAPGLPFHEAVIAFKFQQCRERRDKVFALIGLLDHEGRAMMTPNYQDSVRQVFVQAATIGLVSLWRSKDRQSYQQCPTQDDRMYCGALGLILDVPDHDIEPMLLQAVTQARSYMQHKGFWSQARGLMGSGPPIIGVPSKDCELTQPNSAGLQPEASIDDREFGNGIRGMLRAFKEDLTHQEIQDYSAVDLKRLTTVMARIQREQKATGTLQDMTRLRGFVNCMKAYGEVAGTVTGRNDLLAFVWAPMKVLLEITYKLPVAFDGLLKQYKALGESMPAPIDVQTLPDYNNERSEIVGVIWRNVFEFHRLALRYFKKPAWRELFSATRVRLDVQLSGFIKTIDEHRLLVERQANALGNEEARQARSDTSTQLRELLKETTEARRQVEESFRQLDANEIRRRRFDVLTWLSAPDAVSDQDHNRELRNESGLWLLRNARYRSWSLPHSDAIPLLWVRGFPGSGKSVLASLFVDESLKLADTITLFFYCKHKNPEKNSFVAMTRSLLHQLALKDETLLVYLFEAATTEGETTLNTIKLARKVLKTCLKASKSVHVIIDGLDECEKGEQKHIVDFWSNYVDDNAYSCHCALFGQDDETLGPLLSKLPSIQIEGQSHSTDIRSFCSKKALEIKERFQLSPLEAERVANQTWSLARGMFLFARVVMDNLLAQVTKAEFLAEMRPDVFPQGLHAAYGRIAEKIFSQAQTPSSRNARRVLGLVACANRPMKWQEIQAALSIDSDTGSADYLNHRIVVSYRDLCGSLLEQLPNGDIDFVHTTAKMYLINRHRMELGFEHLRLTKLCLTYFCLPAFNADLSDQSVHDWARRGIYAFMNYAIIHWIAHFELALDNQPHDNQLNTLENALANFFELHWKTPRKRPKPTTQITKICDRITHWGIHGKVKETMSAMHCLMATSIPDMESVYTLDLFAVIARIRSIVQDMEMQERQNLYGVNVFKCPRIYCRWYHEGFASRIEQDEHIAKHERPHLCADVGCMYAVVGFPTAKDLSAHVSSHHGHVMSESEFPDELTEPDPPEQNHDSPHDPQTIEHLGSASSLKHPASFQCNLCPKQFTRAYNLKSHLRSHTDERPFVCTVCGMAFARMNDQKRHEASHNGQRKFVCKGTLEIGPQWGCGRRFWRADALGRHFRSDAGRVCIQPLLDEEAAFQRRAQLEEQQPVNRVVPQPIMAQPETNLGNFLPQALLDQFPALASIEYPTQAPSSDQAEEFW